MLSFARHQGMTVQKPGPLVIAGNVVLCGAATGTLVGLCLATVIRVANPMCYLWSTLMTFMAILVASAFLTRHGASRMLHFTLSVWSLILVACLTLIIPVLGPVFGGTGSWGEVPLITLLGVVGGGVWSVPFAGVFVRSSRTRHHS